MHFTVSSFLLATFCLAITKNVKSVRATVTTRDLLHNAAASDTAALVAKHAAATPAAAHPRDVNGSLSPDLLAVDSKSTGVHENTSSRRPRYLFYPYAYGGYYGGYGGYGYGYGYPGYYGYAGYYPYYAYPRYVFG